MNAIVIGWNWEPSILIGLAVLTAVYLAAAGPLRPRLTTESIRRAQMVWFLMGELVLFLALVSPIDQLGDRYLFSAHMTQHLMLTLVAPPLLMIGTPGWMLRPFLRDERVLKVARYLTTPIVAFAIFNFDFSIWHLPAFYEATLENETIHIVEHLLFIGTAILNWWPMLSPLPELPRLPEPVQILYLFLDAVPATVLGAIFSFGTTVLYPTYAAAPRVFGISALDDQVYSGLIMAMPGAMIYLLVLSIVFFKWLGREERADREKAVTP